MNSHFQAAGFLLHHPSATTLICFFVFYISATKVHGFTLPFAFWNQQSCNPITYLPNVSVNGTINSIVRSGDTAYIGGVFTEVQGQARTNLAAIDIPTGNLLPFNPSADGAVHALVISGTTLYVGGAFTSIGGSSRNRIAALSTTSDTNNATSWNPDANNWVHSLLLNGTSLYVGGRFTSIGGDSRNNFAAISTVTNTNNVLPWGMEATGTTSGVTSMALSGAALYLGGDFTSLSFRSSGAVVSSAGEVNAQFPRVNGSVRAAVPDGSGGWYIGGNFTTVGGVARNRLARINSDGSVHSWNPDADNIVYTMVLSGTTLYVGGTFTAVGGASRNRIAAISTTTDTNNATTWNPNVSTGTAVNTMVLSGTTLYVGGAFTAIGGASRNRIAALSTTTDTNNATSWNPSITGVPALVYSMVLSGTTMYVGGTFTSAGGASRNHIAALSTTTDTNNATTWNPGASGGTPIVFSLALSGTTLYVGGTFTTIGGAARNRIAALSTTTDTNNATTWNPGASSDVETIALVGTTLYAGGAFTTIGGATRARVAGLDTTTDTNNATSWNPSANANVSRIVSDGTNFYVGGTFTTIGITTRYGIARLNSDGTVHPWNPGVSGSTVNAIVVDGTTVYAGGNFTSMGGSSRNRLAAISTTTDTNNATPWNPGANGIVSSLAVEASTVYAGGNFTTIGGASRSRIAGISTATNTNNATSWNPGSNGEVLAMSLSDKTLLSVGSFTIFGDSASRVRFAGSCIP